MVCRSLRLHNYTLVSGSAIDSPFVELPSLKESERIGAIDIISNSIYDTVDCLRTLVTPQIPFKGSA